MRTWLSLAIAVGVLAGAGARLVAHHSYAAAYLEDDTIEVGGTIVEFRYENPHSWLFVSGSEVGGLGGTKVYGAEWVSTSALERQDIEKDTLKPGDFVVITGSPGRNSSELKMHLKAIDRPADGWKWPARRGQQ